jgi:hypothetical protein
MIKPDFSEEKTISEQTGSVLSISASAEKPLSLLLLPTPSFLLMFFN